MTRQARSFALHVTPNGADRYALDLTATSDEGTTVVARLDHRDIDRLRPAVIGAVTASHHARTVLSPTRRAPIPLTADAAVRLALQALAAAPITKPVRVEAMRVGVDAMTSEEALYWFAKATGTNAGRALRALRTLLAND